MKEVVKHDLFVKCKKKKTLKKKPSSFFEEPLKISTISETTAL